MRKAVSIFHVLLCCGLKPETPEVRVKLSFDKFDKLGHYLFV